MTNQIEFNTNNHTPDLAHLIRSVQRLEGNPQCFGSVYKNCEQRDCAWLEYCLKEAKKNSAKNKE